MTKRDALAEARRRWGPQAYVRVEASTLLHKPCLVGYMYGRIDPPDRARCLGHGNTWEEAFQDAERRSASDKT